MENNQLLDHNDLQLCRPQWKANTSTCLKKSFMQTTTVYQDYVITYGGDEHGLPQEMRKQINAYHIPTNTWEKIIFDEDSLIPASRGGHSAFLYEKNKILVFGGWTGSVILGELAIIRIQEIKPFTIKYEAIETKGGEDLCRWGHSADLYKNHMYVFGGRFKFKTGSEMQSTNELWCLDLGNLEWKKLETTGDVPEERDNHCSAIYGKKLFIFGGFSPSRKTKLGGIHALCLESMKWEEITPKGIQYQPRAGALLNVLGDNLYIFGGGTASVFSSNDLFSYNPENNVLEKVIASDSKTIPLLRDSRGVVYKNSLVIMGGKPAQTEYDPTIHTLDFNESQISQGPVDVFLSSFRDMLFSEKYSDIKFLVEDQEIPAHKIVIASRCSYFEKMFSSGMKEAHSSCLKIEDFKLNTFKVFLSFLYTNQINLTQIKISELHQLADKYCQKELIRICEEFYLKRLNLVNLDKIAALAEQFDSDLLRAGISDYLKLYLQEIKDDEDVLKIKETYKYLLEENSD